MQTWWRTLPPPEAELTAVVASLLRPVALDALHDTITRAMVNIRTLINDFKEIYISRRIYYLEIGIVEMRRQCLYFRCSCKAHHHLVLA